jgi:hypothetical protein
LVSEWFNHLPRLSREDLARPSSECRWRDPDY